MSITAVKEAYSAFKRDCTPHSWLDDAEIDLISAIAQYIINNSADHKTATLPENYISLGEFEDKYKFIAAKTLSKYCKGSGIDANWAIMHMHQWYVHPEKALQYLTSESVVLKKRWKRIFPENE